MADNKKTIILAINILLGIAIVAIATEGYPAIFYAVLSVSILVILPKAMNIASQYHSWWYHSLISVLISILIHAVPVLVILLLNPPKDPYIVGTSILNDYVMGYLLGLFFLFIYWIPITIINMFFMRHYYKEPSNKAL